MEEFTKVRIPFTRCSRTILRFVDVYLFTTLFAEDGNRQKHRQYNTWSPLDLAPLVVEEVTVHNTGIYCKPTLIDKCVGYFKSPNRLLTD